ncbi:M13 family metallopeptidase [Nitrospirillum iridis]|uniref:Endothelin-converting enzyme/putative endopeptidase n=1 Tax=Nitrospirillum iridis TaxID=765888 RepID=A0A7X0AUE4_9PROT|nr:M13 family metallopeptidase [Nitrospirillum iridis]MBB6249887.1 endothelin-converting enzyme/putative endopeptidase [Nitrospirillum iridis]
MSKPIAGILNRAAPIALATALVALPFAATAAESRPADKASATEAALPQVDESVDPCQNFYQYACGPWLKSNPIPSDQSRWGSFNALHERNQTILKTALEDVVAHPNADNQRVGGYYAACMDEAGANAKGAAPIQSLLDRIKALTAKEQLAPLVATLHDVGADVFFGFGALTDFKDATRDIAIADQGGIGLPERDFYTRDDAKSEETRKAYVAHVARTFMLLGDDQTTADAKAQAVMGIETALAKASLNLADRNDPEKTYHKKPTGELAKLAPDFAWDAYFKATGAPAFKTLNIAVPDFMKAVGDVIRSSSVADIQAYLTWHVAHSFSPWLSQAFVDERFAFYAKTLYGTEQNLPRWKRCVAATDNALGEDLGKYYVKAAFGPDQKAKMLTMVKNLKAAYSVDIDQLDWMSPETKKRAHEKLDTIVDKIGYPDKWRDYSKLEVKKDDLVGNVQRANAFETARQLAKIGKPHDRAEWQMSPPTVNAYYDPTENDINFPAGILQPPFYFADADDAINYGAIGAVIGHEMTHGFDDQGRQFDKNGNLKDWWTKQDAAKFKQRAQCVVDEYDGFIAMDDVHLNGKAELGENLADNGGHAIALKALLATLKGVPAKKEGRFTEEQKFFLGYAQVWCSNQRDQARRTQAQTDVHALSEYRVNGVVSNNPEFAKAFNCKADAPMNRGAKACKVW